MQFNQFQTFLTANLEDLYSFLCIFTRILQRAGSQQRKKTEELHYLLCMLIRVVLFFRLYGGVDALSEHEEALV